MSTNTWLQPQDWHAVGDGKGQELSGKVGRSQGEIVPFGMEVDWNRNESICGKRLGELELSSCTFKPSERWNCKLYWCYKRRKKTNWKSWNKTSYIALNTMKYFNLKNYLRAQHVRSYLLTYLSIIILIFNLKFIFIFIIVLSREWGRGEGAKTF